MKIIPRPEFPRPDFRRDCWQCLNGVWEFGWDDSRQGEQNNWGLLPAQLPQSIKVPFAYQTPASGVGDAAFHETVWYQRRFDLESPLIGKRVFLKFGAVDYEAFVYLNGRLLGTHEGGYTPFAFDITPLVRPTENLLTVKVIDRAELSQPRGKQYWKEQPDRCWYVPTTGIWQSVWLEACEGAAIEEVKITPDIDRSRVEIELLTDDFHPGDEIEVEVRFRGKRVRRLIQSTDGRFTRLCVPLLEEDAIDEVHYWTPETPNLYNVVFTLRSDGRAADRIESYFGMRSVCVRDGKVLLNHKPCYQKLILDQGYWAESGLTPPSDDAIRRDVELCKEYGFNGARKHQKPEDPRYYYWCDVLGLLVWGELPSAYQFRDAEICNLTRDLQQFLRRDYNHPCIIAWVPLNESWGVRKLLTDYRQQQLAQTLYHLCKAIDPIRLVSANDGWEVVGGDIAGIHDYAQTGEEIRNRYCPAAMEYMEAINQGHRRFFAYGQEREAQALMLTEYGGIALAGQSKNGSWGYAQAEADAEALAKRYADVTAAILSLPQFCGFCYTQLTDVYQEVNGLLDADHQIKVPPEMIAAANADGV